MGLRLKFNLVLLAGLLVGMALASTLLYRLIYDAARHDILAQASIMDAHANAISSYTADEIAPLVASQFTSSSTSDGSSVRCHSHKVTIGLRTLNHFRAPFQRLMHLGRDKRQSSNALTAMENGMKSLLLASTFLLLIAAFPDFFGELDLKQLAMISGELGTFAGNEVEDLGTSKFADDEAGGCANGDFAASEASRADKRSAVAFGMPAVRTPLLYIGPIAIERWAD